MGSSSRSTPLSWTFAGLIVALAAGGTAVRAGDSPPGAGQPDPAEEEFFESKVRPVLVEHCLECHGAEKSKGGLRLDASRLDAQGGRWRPGGRAGQARREHARRGDPLRQRRADAPQGEAQGCRDRRLTDWVKRGAHWPSPRPAGSNARRPRRSTALRGRDPNDLDTTSAAMEQARSFWSFRPIGDPEPPPVRDAAWPTSPSTGSSSPAWRPTGSRRRRRPIRRP